MKRIYSLFGAAVAIFAAVACNQELDGPVADVNNGGKAFTAVMDIVETKAVLSEKVKTLWEPGDAIQVSDGETAAMYVSVNTENASTASFVPYPVENAVKGTTVVALYGLEAKGVDMTSLTVSGVSIPSDQEARLNSFQPYTAVAMAYSETDVLEFKNAVALLKFRVMNDKVAKVRITSKGGEAVTGSASLAYNSGKPSFEVVDGKDYVELSVKEGFFKMGRDYYVSVFPQTLASGFDVKFVFDGASTMTDVKTKTGSVTFKRNTILNLGELEYVVSDPAVIYKDNFDWVAPWADAGGAADSVGENNASGSAPNVYSNGAHKADGVEAGYPAFLTEFTERGYEDINASKSSFYTQKYYLKFGKSDAHTGIKLPALNLSSATDVQLSFNWAAQKTGSGAIDNVKLLVELEGDGTCGDSGEKTSWPFETQQANGTLEWQDATLTLRGVTSGTRITIRPTVLDNSDGVDQKRWYLDNILVSTTLGSSNTVEPDMTPEIPEDAVTVAKWVLDETTKESNSALFATPAGDDAKVEGFGGKYVPAQEGNGKIQYWSVDKTTLDSSSKFSRVIGSTGEPYITGAWAGDYWYITATLDEELAAGSNVYAYFVEKASGTGMKYWLVEYLDNGVWKPAFETKNVEIDGQGTITYNVELKGTAEYPIYVLFTTTAATKEIAVRSTCVANAQANGNGALQAPNSGTIRLKGAAESPYIKVK